MSTKVMFNNQSVLNKLGYIFCQITYTLNKNKLFLA